MNYVKSAAAYREAAILSSSPEQIVVLLYDRLLVSLKRAANDIRQENLEAKAESLDKASAIVFELLGALDREKGGELAQRLAALYAYLVGEISTINRTLDLARLAHITSLVETLHASWSEAAHQVPAQNHAQVAP